MKTILPVLLILILAAPLWAGSIAIDLGGTPLTIDTAKYEPAIQRLTDEFNIRQPDLPDGARPLGIPREQYIKRVFVSAFESYVRQVRKRDAAIACTAYNAKDTAGKQEVMDLLGGKSPCQ